MSEHFPIGITNRFDLTPADGANCGQYRLIYARKSQNSLHIIFEGVLPNPNPAEGIAGCRAVAQFWAGLTVDSLDERRAKLETFFFQGLPGFSPMVTASNYADAGGIPRDYLMAESDPDPSAQMFVYDVPFANGMATADGKAFSERIAAELTRIGSTLTPAQIVVRAETQTCVGCHFLSGDQGEGMTFSRSDNLAHVTESLEAGEGGPQSRFAVSPAVSDVFVPHRMAILREFLATGTAPVHSN